MVSDFCQNFFEDTGLEIYPPSFIDVLEELEEDETDTDLLDENSGRDAETRLFMAVDRLKDLR